MVQKCKHNRTHTKYIIRHKGTPSYPCVGYVLNYSVFMMTDCVSLSGSFLNITKVKMIQMFSFIFYFFYPLCSLFCLLSYSFVWAPVAVFLLLTFSFFTCSQLPPLCLLPFYAIPTCSSILIIVFLNAPPFCIRQETDAAKFVSNGMCQFHVLQNRNAYLQC